MLVLVLELEVEAKDAGVGVGGAKLNVSNSGFDAVFVFWCAGIGLEEYRGARGEEMVGA